jgi:hypothetical protein
MEENVRPDYDSIKNDIDVAIRNIDPTVDTSAGTITNLIVSGNATVIAGLYGYADMIGRKAFPDLCNFEDLKRWANIKGVDYDETTLEDVLRQDVLRSFRVPPSSGDEWSFRAAIKEFYSGVFAIFENWRARGLGTVDIVLGHTANYQEHNSVQQNVLRMRPLGLADLQFSIAKKRPIDIRIICTGVVDTLAVSRAVTDRFGEEGDIPGSDLFRSVIEAIAVQHGAADATMFWQDEENPEWQQGTCEAKVDFNEFREKIYEHLIIENCEVVLR